MLKSESSDSVQAKQTSPSLTNEDLLSRPATGSDVGTIVVMVLLQSLTSTWCMSEDIVSETERVAPFHPMTLASALLQSY